MNKKRLAEHLEKIMTFKSVADLKSVQKASSRLGLSQPAVTRTIKVLENVLECRLTERESRGIKLTPEGVRLYEYAKILNKSLVDFNEGDVNLSNHSSLLRVATYDNIACQNISRIMKKLMVITPHLSISVGGPNSRILGDLIGGKFDCAFVAEPRILPGLKYKNIFTERYGIFIASDLYKKSGLKKKPQVSADEIKELCFITMPDAIAGVNKNIDRLLWEAGLKSSLAVDSYEVALQLTRDGAGIGIMPISTAWRDLCQKNLFELSLKGTSKSSWGQHKLTLCWNPKQEHPGVEFFGKAMGDLFSTIKE